MYARAASATITPTPAATGTHTSRHRRVRDPIATISSTTVTTWMLSGSQPPSSETPCPYLLKFGSGNGGIGVGTGGVVEPGGGTAPVWEPFLKKC
jgi:hypothetical protein